MVPKVPVNVAAGLVFRLNEPPPPEIIVQVPVPLVGVFAAEGCAFYQGFLRAQPMGAAEFGELACR